MTDTILIDDIEYNIEDEELDEVSYYEILTIDEIIKDNPIFIAFTKEEVFNELNNFFEDSSKSQSIAELFFKDKSINTMNYVFVGDVTKKQRQCNSNFEEETNEFQAEFQEFISDLVKIRKLPYNISKEQTNKYFFAISYDTESKALRMKPHMRTMIRFQEKNINIFYPVFPEDDTNIPILSIYYKQPHATMYDFMSEKVLEHTKGYPNLFNYTDAESYSDIEKLVQSVKPKMKHILEKVEFDIDDYHLDFNNIDILLRKFDTSLDDINIHDFELLREKLEHVLEIKPEQIKYKPYKIKEKRYLNNKLTFYDKIQNIGKLLDIPDKVKEDYILLVTTLQEQKFELNAQPLIYNNINDIVNAVVNSDIEIEDIIENIDANRQVIVYDHAITTLKNITENNATDIQNALDELHNRFTSLKEIKNDIFELHFIDFYKELIQIREGNDTSDYDGIPDVYRNEPVFDEQQGFWEDTIETSNISQSNVSNMMLEKYWLSPKYKEAKGFIEMLKIALPTIHKIQDIAKLNIDFDLLSNELYKHFAGIPTKYNILYNIFKKNEIKESDEYIRQIVNITPRVALSEKLLSEYDELKLNNILTFVKECNEEFIKYYLQMIHVALTWWSIRTQDDLIENIKVVEENLFDPRYIDKWSIDGEPLKESSKGVMVYLCSIAKDMIEQDMGYKSEDILKSVIKVKNEKYEKEVEALIENNKNIAKRANKGTETYRTLQNIFKEKNKDKLLVSYIDALIYMPGYKFKKAHKFLLGCCLQKIGKDFIAFSDLSKNERKDLIAAKTKYSKKRETINTSKMLYCPITEQNVSNTSHIKYVLYENDKDGENAMTVDTWLEDMRNTTPLLPENVINMLKTNPRNSHQLSKNNVRIFCKTSGYVTKANELEDQLYNTTNYSNILRRICFVLKKLNIDRTPEESKLLLSGIDVINSILEDIDHLHEIIDEYNKNQIRYIKHYILTRAICIPFNPDIANENNDILYSSITTSNSFVNNVTKTIYGTITKYISKNTMPTYEDNLNFINKIREENKHKTLEVMNLKSNDERMLIDQLKKIGMKKESEQFAENDPSEDNNENFDLNGLYGGVRENNENDEFLMVGENEDGDDNYLD